MPPESDPTPVAPDEILPPDAREPAGFGETLLRDVEKKDPRLARTIAWLLDECIRIPGTNFRVGLDPILGLIPGGGETVATVIGTLVLGDATRRGIPFRMLLKMAGNMLLNAGIGAIPGIGDVFSAWFKSNSRNLDLMRAHLRSADGAAPAAAGGRCFSSSA